MKSLSHLCYRGLGKEIKDFFLRELSRKRWILLVNKEHTSPLQRNHHILSYLLTRFGVGGTRGARIMTKCGNFSSAITHFFSILTITNRCCSGHSIMKNMRFVIRRTWIWILTSSLTRFCEAMVLNLKIQLEH